MIAYLESKTRQLLAKSFFFKRYKDKGMKKIFIGIDFSKEKFDVTLIEADGLKECAPSVHELFENKTSGYRRLVRWVKPMRTSWLGMPSL